MWLLLFVYILIYFKFLLLKFNFFLKFEFLIKNKGDNLIWIRYFLMIEMFYGILLCQLGLVEDKCLVFRVGGVDVC